MRIIAYHIEKTTEGKVCILESTDESCLSNNINELFAFLLEPFQANEEINEEGRKILLVCWDLDTTVAPLVRLLGATNATKLSNTHKLYYPPFNLFYVPGKVFHIKLVPSPYYEMFLYHLAQYYPDLEEPEALDEVHALGVKLVKELANMGLHPSKLTSPVAIYEQEVMRGLDLPKWLDIPKGACEYAMQCSGKLWIEAYKIGYFP
jgi:hypothetical protein